MEQNKIYLSVVLSTYNEEKYIAESIQSVLDQTYPYFEFIIVNDGSTDGTLDIIRSFDDQRIVIIDKQNTGLPDSLNKGIERAKYDWIARMDGDDICLPERFEKQVELIKAGYDVIGGQFKTIDENGDFMSSGESHNPLSPWKSKFYAHLGWTPLIHPSAVINKKKLLAIGCYDTNFKAAQDIDLWLRLSHYCRIANVPNVVLHYRKHKNTITSNRKELQTRLSFLAFMKYCLRIDKSLSPIEFEQFKNIIDRMKLTEKNYLKFQKCHDPNGSFQRIRQVLYYAWRTFLLVKFRITRTKVLSNFSAK